MERTRKSLWTATVPGTLFSPLDKHHVTDVAVIGGGITGLTTALLLEREGIDVTVLEANRVGCGTSGYTTGKVTALQSLIYSRLESNFGVSGAKLYASAQLSAMEQIRTLAEAREIPCALECRSAYTYSTDPGDESKIRDEVAAARRAGLDATFTTETELPYDVVAVRLDDQWQFNSYRYCVGLAAALHDGRAQIHEQTLATGVEDLGDHFLVRTRTGAMVEAQRVVVATLLPFLDRGAFFAKTAPSRTYLTAYRVPGGSPLKGMYLSTDEPTRTLRAFGEFLLVGGESHRVGEEPDPKARYAAIEAWARQHFGVESPQHRWSSHDYMPLDDVPYIGRMPRSRDELMVATGMRKWGLTNGTVAAMILRDSIVGRSNSWADLFSATRVDALNSATRFVKDNAEVARHFVSDRIDNPTKTASIEGLAPGEGGIVTVEGEKVAAFRDDSGTLHLMSPVCPHMGCHLTWNNAEKSWDCPCHGSCFDATGHFVAGPAASDMRRK